MLGNQLGSNGSKALPQRMSRASPLSRVAVHDGILTQGIGEVLLADQEWMRASEHGVQSHDFRNEDKEVATSDWVVGVPSLKQLLQVLS